MQGVQNFYSAIRKNSFSRTHLFRIFQISNEVKITDDMLVYATSTDIPTRKIGMSSGLKYRGYSAIVPEIASMEEGDRNIKLTFYCDEKMKLYQMMYKWHKEYWNEVACTGKNYNFDNIFHSVVLNAKNNSMMDLKCYGVFPKSISNVSYSFANDEIQKFTVTLVFQYFEIAQSEKAKQSIFEQIRDIVEDAGDVIRGVSGGIGDVRGILGEF
jgi:hypothetical protein